MVFPIYIPQKFRTAYFFSVKHVTMTLISMMMTIHTSLLRGYLAYPTETWSGSYWAQHCRSSTWLFVGTACRYFSYSPISAGNPIVEIRGSYDCFISTMGFLYSSDYELGPFSTSDGILPKTSQVTLSPFFSYGHYCCLYWLDIPWTLQYTGSLRCIQKSTWAIPGVRLETLVQWILV